jgi:hypothetical protein
MSVVPAGIFILRSVFQPQRSISLDASRYGDEIGRRLSPQSHPTCTTLANRQSKGRRGPSFSPLGDFFLAQRDRVGSLHFKDWENSGIMDFVWAPFFVAMRNLLRYLKQLRALNEQALDIADPQPAEAQVSGPPQE